MDHTTIILGCNFVCDSIQKEANLKVTFVTFWEDADKSKDVDVLRAEFLAFPNEIEVQTNNQL